MEIEKKNKEIEWYDNPDLIVNILLGLNICIIILSQAFAIRNNLDSSQIFRNLFNHNSIYVLTLIYLVFLKTKVGKKYFNFLNIILIAVYVLLCVASLLTVFQSFGLGSLIYLALNIIMLVYLVNTFVRDTRFWNEFSLHKVPMDELNNDWYFYAILVLSVIHLTVGLIETTNFDDVVLLTLGAIYTIIFSRYIYLYKAYLENKKIKKEVKKG